VLIAWPLLALATALCECGRDLLLRHLLQGQGRSVRLVMGAGCLLAALPAWLLLPLWPMAAGTVHWPQLGPALLATALVNGVAFWGYGRSLARGDLSLVVPLINLSPLVLMGIGPWLLGEWPTARAGSGVLLLAAGALLLAVTGGGRPGPPLALLTAPGAPTMLLVALLWGLGAGIDKLGVLASGPLPWVIGLNLVVGLPLLLPALAAGERLAPPGRWPALVAYGLLGCLGMLCQMLALGSTAVVHVIAIKRLSTLFSAGVGVLLLGEPLGVLRLPAAALMLAGAVLLLWSGGAG
jgi:drug/metabolite transporter (DMT)-like permease